MKINNKIIIILMIAGWIAVGLGILFFVLVGRNVINDVNDRFIIVGIALAITGGVCVAVANGLKRLPPKSTTVYSKPPIVNETPSGYDYEAHNKRRLEYKSTETTIRTPIELDDPDINKKTAEHKEYMKEFLDSVVYPAGFDEYINDEKFNQSKKYIIKNRSMFGDFFEIEEVCELDKIKKITLDILTGDDYYTQFRDIVIFAGDESGHGDFLLDYGKDKSNPSVKFLDNEIDIVEHVADNFDEFLANLVDEENPVLKEIFEEPCIKRDF